MSLQAEGETAAAAAWWDARAGGVVFGTERLAWPPRLQAAYARLLLAQHSGVQRAVRNAARSFVRTLLRIEEGVISREEGLFIECSAATADALIRGCWPLLRARPPVLNALVHALARYVLRGRAEGRAMDAILDAHHLLSPGEGLGRVEDQPVQAARHVLAIWNILVRASAPLEPSPPAALQTELANLS